MSKGLAHSPSRPLSGGCAGPLLTHVDVEARATSARKECARRPVLSEEVGDGANRARSPQLSNR
jgi:hypothetical protein